MGEPVPVTCAEEVPPERIRASLECYRWLFGEDDDETPAEPRPEPAGPHEPEPDPWEGSAFEDVVPESQWHQAASPRTAAAVRARVLELAQSAGDEEYEGAVEELRAAPWVGDEFKDRIFERAAELRREAG